MAQPSYRLACPRRNGSDRKPRLAAPELPYASASAGVDRGETASFTGRLKGLSCLRGNSHEQFLGGGTAVTPSCYPAIACGHSYWTWPRSHFSPFTLTRISQAKHRNCGFVTLSVTI